MNHPLDRNEMKTFMSANDGRFWFDVEFVYPDRSKLKQSVNFDFRLHDPQSVPENSNWIDIQYEHTDDNVLQPFITLNGGQLWRATPRTNSKIVILKFGSVIVSIDIDSNGINYSFDESTTWFRYDLFKTKPTVLYIGRVPKTDLKAVVVTSEPGSKNLKFTTLDFSHIFKFQCEPKHYLQWTFTRNGETCYRGKNISMLTRDPSIRCVDNIIEHMRADSFCPCTSDDYSCTFNYHSFDDVCILDPLSDTTEQPYDCGSGSHFDLHQMGY
ncbi:VPS10 domain-containing receptor SorCS1 [Thelohanellus kitauei]|uniref:VPS10 domain-containing receptor SorCS1 n=1 Tax=Thelohanellus kitauei TaxID=669202 RepID=A0A0C2MPZ4_THEKT|nr:VPS10 domain-containing receptor SorCS1 [Thelohanellus kitauei]